MKKAVSELEYDAYRAQRRAGAEALFSALPELPPFVAPGSDNRDDKDTHEGFGSQSGPVETWPNLELPGDRPRMPTIARRTAAYEFAIPGPVFQGAQQLCRDLEEDLFTVLCAAFLTQMWRYTGQDDLVLSVHTGGGSKSGDTTGSLGDRCWQLRAQLDDNPAFAELVSSVGKSCDLESASSQRKSHSRPRDVRVQGRWRPAMHPGNIPVVFEFDCNGRQSIPTADFELALRATQSRNGLAVRWTYDADLFDEARIKRMAEHFDILLAACVKDPQWRLAELPLMTSAERQTVLMDWNQTQAYFPEGVCLHELFEAQVERTPDALALVFEQRRWTYHELNAEANQLAHYLQSLGVGPGVPVGICLKRSDSLVLGLLATLKAGAAYVPLDPYYPQDRLAFMLEDVRATILLTERRISRNLPVDGIRTIDLEEAGPLLTGQSAENPRTSVRSSDPAYIIYTSGSTGQPKGVVVEHRNAVHSTTSRMHRYPEGVGNFIMIPSFAFDASVPVIFWTLSCGGTLSLPAQGAEQDIVRLAEWIAEHRITHWLSVPSLYQLLLEQPADRLATLKTVIVGGEACPPSMVARHLAKLPQANLYNEYGPTEGTVWSTVYHCASDDISTPVPIGKPIRNMRLYVLDRHQNPLPIGFPGELYLAGAGLARGYLHNPQLTADKFVSNPFEGPGTRMYRTGDLVRYLPDGNLEFLGRIDSQVKLRGYRIELGEIEAALCRQPSVAAASVVVDSAAANQKQLVAYVVPYSTHTLSPQRLRRALKDSLPEYMIPTFFVSLDALPLTPHGKVDRNALPAPDRRAVVRQHGFESPCDELEARMAAVWEQVFDFQLIGVCDDFFDLGGDSLLAAGLIARIEHEFGHELSLDTLLERPTIRALTALIRSPTTVDVKNSIVKIQCGGSKPPLFCLPGIGGNLLEFHNLASRLDPEQPVYGFHPAGLNDQRQPHTTIEEMAAFAVQQLRTVQPHGPYRFAGYSLGGVVAFEMAQQLQTAGERTELLALLDARTWAPLHRGFFDRPFSLALLDARIWSPPQTLPAWQKLRRHWLNWRARTARGRLKYTGNRLQSLVTYLTGGAAQHPEEDVTLGLDLSDASRRMARLHYLAWRHYQPKSYDGGLTLFVAQPYGCALHELDRHPMAQSWARVCSKSVQVVPVQGTHAEMLRAETCGVLAARLDEWLRQLDLDEKDDEAPLIGSASHRATPTRAIAVE